MTRREKDVRKMIAIVREKYPQAVDAVAIFYEPSHVPAPPGAHSFHVQQWPLDKIDDLLRSRAFVSLNFSFAGIAVLVEANPKPGEPGRFKFDHASFVQKGQDFEFRRAAVRALGERLSKPADELAAQDKAAAQEIIEYLHHEASKN